VIGEELGTIACPSATTCYARGVHSVVRTTTSGKSWSIRSLLDPTSYARGSDLACASPTACYVAAGFTVLKTSDGFDHTLETLAQSVIHDLSLRDISCPSTASCYAAGTHSTCPRAGSCAFAIAGSLTRRAGSNLAVFAGTRDQVAAQIGNAVPPPLMARLTSPLVPVYQQIRTATH
jgi:hypothetical protein